MTVEEFLKKHGQSAECIDTEASMHRFREQMRLGLRGEGGMPMIPTYLANVDRASITTGKRILIDAGGTNFRSAIGYFDASGGVHIEEQVKTVMPASDGYMSKSRFYERIADNVKRLLPMSDTIGFCFSYPVDMGADIDGYVRPFTKEVKAPEVVGTRVGRETVAACKAVDGRDRRIVILNDTVATLLGGMALSNRQYSGYRGAYHQGLRKRERTYAGEYGMRHLRRVRQR